MDELGAAPALTTQWAVKNMLFCVRRGRCVARGHVQLANSANQICALPGASGMNMKPRLIALAASVTVLLLLQACRGGTQVDQIGEARKFLERREHAAAIVSLKSVLQKHPDAPEVRFLLGKALLDSGDGQAALVELSKARELGHPDAEVLPPLALALATSGRGKEAVDKFATVTLDSTAAQAELLISLAVAYGMQGQTQAMQRAVQQALLAEPKHANANIMAGYFMAGRQEFDAAWQVTEQVLAREPRHAKALHFKGILQRYVKNDLPGAMAAQRQALEIDPSIVQAHGELLGMLFLAKDRKGMRDQLAALQRALPKNLNTFVFHAQLEFLDGNLKGAREILQQLLRTKHQDERALMLAATIEFRTGALASAETYLGRVLKMQPEFAQARHMLAATYVRGGQPEKALSALQPLIDSGKAETTTYGLAAEALLQLGKLSKAQEFFQRASKLSPDDPRLKTAMALNRIAQGQSAQGLADLESVAKAETSTFADLALISAQLRGNNLDAALRAIDRLEAKEPDKPLAANLRGQVLAKKGDAKAARASYERALGIDPSSYPSAAALANMDLADKRLDLAKTRFETVLSRDPANHRAMLALAELRRQGGEPAEKVLELLVEAVKRSPTELQPRQAVAEHHLHQKAFKNAITAAQEGLAALPDNPELLDVLGRAQFAALEYQQAINTFRKIAALLPQSPQPHLQLAEVYLARKERDAAAQSLQRALDVKPDLLAAQVRQVELSLEQKDFKQALAIARRVQQARPRDGVGYLLEGNVHRRQQRWEPAIASLRTSMQRGASTDGAVALHAALVSSGKKADAERFAAGWRAEHPRDVRFLLHLGSEQMKTQRWADAEQTFRAVAELVPADPVANNNIAWTMLKQRKSGAVGFAEKATRSMPESAALLDTLALALTAEGQESKAMVTIKKAIALDPNSLDARLTLSRIALKSGDKALARAELEKLAWLGDKFPNQAEVAELLTAAQ